MCAIPQPQENLELYSPMKWMTYPQSSNNSSKRDLKYQTALMSMNCDLDEERCAFVIS